jgi:hypothetical protein
MLKRLCSRYTRWIKASIICVTIAFCSYVSVASADIETITLSTVLANMNTTSADLAGILQNLCLLIGICFIIAGIFKAHQHKNNPTQITFGHSLTLIVIGAALILFPYLLKLSAKTLMGTTTLPQVGGSEIQQLIGASSS